jgi:DNA-binding NtrC family response regulator
MLSRAPFCNADGVEYTDLGRTILARSIECWGEERAVALLGRSPAMADAQRQLLQCTRTEGPVLITGETGSGKELFARGMYLLSGRCGRPFMAINCAQYQDGHLLASELFGHAKGSFTGAVTDRRSIFEEAHGGVVFLDEVAELPSSAQAMLLRVLGEGEVVRVGENRPRRVNVRTLAATAVDLESATAEAGFRRDLFYRLRGIRLRIPPLRERHDDWRLIADYCLRSLTARHFVLKHFSGASLELLASYRWPGNIRELRSIVEQGYFMSSGDVIEPFHFAADLLPVAEDDAGDTAPPIVPGERRRLMTADDDGEDAYRRIRGEGRTFWDAVYEPYMNRELNRSQVKAIVKAGLRETQGSYKRLLPLIGIAADEYIRFMDFLRHHALKPSRVTAITPAATGLCREARERVPRAMSAK